MLALEELLYMRGGHGASNKVVNGDGVLDSNLRDAWIRRGTRKGGCPGNDSCWMLSQHHNVIAAPASFNAASGQWPRGGAG